MYQKIDCCAVTALETVSVAVEVDISEGFPYFEMVGLLAGEVKEAKERVRAAMGQLGLLIPAKRVTVNLSPASLRKEGSVYDLAIAVGVMGAMGEIAVSSEMLRQCLFLGELTLEGSIRPVNGVLPAAIHAKEWGYRFLFVPRENGKEAVLDGGAEVVAVSHLKEVRQLLNGDGAWHAYSPESERTAAEETPTPDYSEIFGQRTAKRAAEIAAAGRHNLLLVGSPGSGKTLLAAGLRGILPAFTVEECLDVTKVYSIAGKLEGRSRIYMRPFRAPHHTCSKAGMAGGGRIPVPGEITLAHRGVLFLDEFPEFSRGTLEVLREPMERGEISMIRAGREYRFPADFMLVAAMNACPCGYYPEERCRCSQHERKKYMEKIKGPLVDRIDLCTVLRRVSWDDLSRRTPEEPSAVIRERVEDARKRQRIRYRSEAFDCNGRLPGSVLFDYLGLTTAAEDMLGTVYEGLQLGARGYHKLLRTARTIADLEDSDSVTEIHVSEAVTYRLPGEVLL